MNRILVDTSVVIDYLRQRDKGGSLCESVFIDANYQVVLALVVLTELWSGKSMLEKEEEGFVVRLVEGCEILIPNIEIAKKAGVILRENDYKKNFPDAEIAATAVVENLPLLTLNKKHFEGIKGIEFWELE